MNWMLKKFTIIVCYLLTGSCFAQDPSDVDRTLHDSLIKYAMNDSAHYYTFAVREQIGLKFCRVEYGCDVYKNKILRIERSYRIGNRSKKDADTVTYTENALFLNGQLLEFSHNEVPMFYKLKGKGPIEKTEGDPWQATMWFNYGNLFHAFTNGHGLGETDDWDPQAYAERISQEMLRSVRKKYPKWK
jgi:hypothetical protein